MKLNNIKPADGSRSRGKRVGRGIGSGLGKTCGRGHKGQHSRSGGSHTPGFEGGQQPLQKRLPKIGFSSRVAHTVGEVRLYQLASVKADIIDMESLLASRVITRKIKRVKVVNTGSVDKAYHLKGLKVTEGAKAAIEAAGGKVE
ncbi:MAG: 50S ribosomal protein L15 [bacterium]